jgi:hypothetical protein
MDQLPPPQGAAYEHWDAEFQFWHKLITNEVERLRFNEGLEPVEVDLYPVPKTLSGFQPDFIGKTKIGRRTFRAIGKLSVDKEGKNVLRVQIWPEPQ